jgi:hypothetical protein
MKRLLSVVCFTSVLLIAVGCEEPKPAASVDQTPKFTKSEKTKK